MDKSKNSNKNISCGEFAQDLTDYLQKINLDVEINFLNYKEFRFNFEIGKFERIHKNLIPVINGIGNVKFEQCEDFRQLNKFLFSEYERLKLNENKLLNFKIRYTPISRRYISGDRIYEINNLLNFESQINPFNLSLVNNSYNLLIFTTPMHFNHNHDVINKFQALEEFSNLNIHLIFLTGSESKIEYEEICIKFINHYKKIFKKLKFSKLPYLENETQYKLLNLEYDPTDPTKFCFFINKDGLILSDFQEFREEIFTEIKSTLNLEKDEYFVNLIKSDKKYEYKNLIINTASIPIDLENKLNQKKLINLIKNFSIIDKAITKNLTPIVNNTNHLTIQLRKYFDVNKFSNGKSKESIEKINISYVLSKKNFDVYQKFNEWCSNFNLFENNKNLIHINEILLDNKNKFSSTLKIINDELQINKIDEVILSPDYLKITNEITFDNGLKKKIYSIKNNINCDLEEIFKESIPPHYLKQLKILSDLENEINKEKKMPSYIFNDLFLVPRLTLNNKIIPIQSKLLSKLNKGNENGNGNGLNLDDNKVDENDNIDLLVNQNQVLIYYFFTAWSSPSMNKLKELNNLCRDYENQLSVYCICIDSNLEELKENLVFNLFENKNEKVFINLYHSDTRIIKEFDVFKKLYGAYFVNNNLIIFDKKGVIKFIDNSKNAENLDIKIKSLLHVDEEVNTDVIYSNGKEIKKNSNVVTNPTSAVVVNDTNESKNEIENFYHYLNSNMSINLNFKILSKFYKDHIKDVKYSNEYFYKLIYDISIDDNFKIKERKIFYFELRSQFRELENKKLNEIIIENFKFPNINKTFTNKNKLFKNEILEIVDLSNILEFKTLLCSICNKCDNSTFFYYCYECQNLTCHICQPKHEHNLILFRIENKNKCCFNNIDKDRLGDNLSFYGTLKSRNHIAGCNNCETLINNKARFICLNCLPGKTPLKTGYNDFCEDCVKKFITKWQNYEKYSDKLKIKNQTDGESDDNHHDEFDHLYLRLDYSVSYFGY